MFFGRDRFTEAFEGTGSRGGRFLEVCFGWVVVVLPGLAEPRDSTARAAWGGFLSRDRFSDSSTWETLVTEQWDLGPDVS